MYNVQREAAVDSLHQSQLLKGLRAGTEQHTACLNKRNASAKKVFADPVAMHNWSANMKREQARGLIPTVPTVFGMADEAYACQLIYEGSDVDFVKLQWHAQNGRSLQSMTVAQVNGGHRHARRGRPSARDCLLPRAAVAYAADRRPAGRVGRGIGVYKSPNWFISQTATGSELRAAELKIKNAICNFIIFHRRKARRDVAQTSSATCRRVERVENGTTPVVSALPTEQGRHPRWPGPLAVFKMPASVLGDPKTVQVDLVHRRRLHQLRHLRAAPE
jgi:hypothetical protein